MITLYSPWEIDFRHHGLGVLQPEKAIVTQELNGVYSLELTIIQSSRNAEKIEETFLIKAPTPDGEQLFRVYRTKKNMDKRITIDANHVFYDSAYDYIKSCKLTGSPDSIIKKIYENSTSFTNINASSNIDGNYTLELSDTNPVSAIMGNGGLIEQSGGELWRDNFEVLLLPNIGTNRGFSILYRKNLTGLDVEIDISETMTRAIPIAFDSSGNRLYLPEKSIDSPFVNQYPFPLQKVVELNDIRVGSNGMTTIKAYEEMRKIIYEKYENGEDTPKINAKIDFILLQHTNRYHEYKFLQKVHIGDTVTVIHEGLGVHITAKCIKYKYDAILEKYIEIETGEFRNNYATSVKKDMIFLQTKAIQNAISNLPESSLVEASDINGNIKIDGEETKVYNDSDMANKSDINNAINHFNSILEEKLAYYPLSPTLIHNLNKYPQVLVMRVNNGFGYGRFGENGFGDRGENYQILSKSQYISRNEIQLNVNLKTEGTPMLRQVDSNAFLYLFDDYSLYNLLD